MKKILKVLLILVVIFGPKVKAQEITDVINEGGNMLPGEYVVKQKNGIRNFQTMNIITRQSDGHFVYCLEPDVFVKEIPIVGYEDNHAAHANLTNSEWNRVMLLSYYGYGYKDAFIDHTDSKWYVVTQFMIWNSVPTEQEIFFTDTLNGNKIIKYESEMAELENLIAKHNILPSFNGQTLNIIVGQELKIKDSNHVLENFNINSSTNAKVSIKKNELTIKSDNVGKTTINFEKSNNIYGVLPIVYVDNNAQNVLFRGDIPNNKASLTIDTKGGSISINKTGEKLNLKNGSYTYIKVPLDGITFDIFNNKETLVTSVTTDKNGKAIVSNLPLGKYYIKEKNTKENMVLDENKYAFEITIGNLNPNLELQNFYAKGTLEFSKKDFVSDLGLPNTIIEIYTVDNTLVFTGKTNESGKIVINNLPIGKYYILEKEAPKGYKLNDNKLYFEIKKNGDVVKSTMKDEVYKGSLDFTKTDISNGNVIPNCLISIYDAKTNEKIFTGFTDKNGKINIKNLSYGKYYLKEEIAPEGYLLNPEKMYFEITKDGQIIKANLTNEIIRVPDTLNNTNYLFYISLIIGGFIIYKFKSKQVALVCFLISISLFLYKSPKLLLNAKNINQNLSMFIDNKKEKIVNSNPKYIATLKIPRINLERGLTLDEKANNVDKNIEILTPFLFPDTNNSNLILAGHSGNGTNAYFNNLKNLTINDEIYLYYQNNIYKYILDNIYEIEKTGYANIIRDPNKTTLTMITCKNGENKQLVFIAYLQSVIPYKH